MASPSVLAFDAEGRAVDFDVWLDDLQLFLQCDSKDGLSLFNLTSGASTAPAADADSAVRSQRLTRDATARLAVRSHLPSTERAHFSQYKSAKTLYDAVVALYSSPATAALSRLMLPYLFPNLAAFATVTDLITHLRTSDNRYHAALPAEFCAKNPPPMYITLYYLVTRLPDTLRSEPLVVTPVPLSLRGAPSFLFCPPLPLLLLSTLLALSRSALRLLLARGAATARASEARALEEVAREEVVAVEAEEVVGVGVEAEVGASVAAVEVEVEAAVAVVVGVEAAEAAAAEVELVEAELGSGDPSTSRALVRPRRHSSFVSGTQGVRGLGVFLLVFAAASGSGPESAPCSCRLLSHQTLLWHHRLGHPSLPRLRGMASRVLVFGLPRSLPPLPLGPAPTCVPCVEGRQRAAPHSSEFPPTEAPLQTLHMDVWGPARVRGQGHERYFLLVVDDYSRYTMVFPLRSKGDVTETFTLPASPQQIGIAERRIGMVMDVAHTSMIHAAAPHFLWPFAVKYAVHQLNLQPRARDLPHLAVDWEGWRCVCVSGLGISGVCPRLVCGQAVPPCCSLRLPWLPSKRAWVAVLPPHLAPCSVLPARHLCKSVPFYRLFPYRTAPLPPPPLFLAPGPPPVDPLPPQGPAPSGVSQVDANEPVEVAVDSGAARGAEPVGAGSGSARSGGAEPWGAESGGAEPGGAEPGGAEPRGADCAAGAGGPPVAPGPRGPRTGGTGAVGTGGAAAAAGASGAAGAGAAGGVGAGVGATGASGAAGAGAAGGVGAGVGPAGGAAMTAGGTGAAGTGAAGVGAVGAGGAAGTGAATSGTGAVPVGSGGPAQPRPYFVPLLEQ
ncbi:unnamed protein product, partial [Closterium sp. NIES-54]